MNTEGALLVAIPDLVSDLVTLKQENIPVNYIRVAVSAKNFGKSTAWMRAFFIKEVFLSAGESLSGIPDYSGQSSGVMEVGTGDVIIPNGHVKRSINVQGSKFVTLSKEEGALYVYGKIDYLDIFNRERTTGFCFKYRGYSFYTSGPEGYNYRR
jgi:hypothetical protein